MFYIGDWVEIFGFHGNNPIARGEVVGTATIQRKGMEMNYVVALSEKDTFSNSAFFIREILVSGGNLKLDNGKEEPGDVLNFRKRS